MSRNLEKITDKNIVKLFDGKNFAFLATVKKDGSPQVTPTWIDRDNDIILINTAKGRLKHRNVTRDPRVSISLVDDQNPYSMITISGRVIEQTTEGADEHIDKLARKYLNADKYPGHSPEVKRVILKIKPEKIFFIPPRYQQYLPK
jgi:PPOX class probable F420-dependent enzyme